MLTPGVVKIRGTIAVGPHYSHLLLSLWQPRRQSHWQSLLLPCCTLVSKGTFRIFDGVAYPYEAVRSKPTPNSGSISTPEVLKTAWVLVGKEDIPLIIALTTSIRHSRTAMR